MLVDASVWIEGLRAAAPAALTMQLQTLLMAKRLLVTDMVRLEVLAGARSPSEFEAFRADLDMLPGLDTTAREWRKAEDLSIVLTRQGRRVAAADLLIAAVSMTHGVPLWHADSDFERVRTVAESFKTFWYPKQSPEP